MRRFVFLTLLLGVGLLMVVPHQGEAATAQRTIRSVDPIVYGLGSFVVPGLGQFALGERGTGFIHLLVAVALPSACYYLTLTSPILSFPVCGLVSLAWHAYSGFDAYNLAGGR